MEFVIKSEDDAYSILEQIKNNQFPDLANYSLKFEGWPRLDLTIRGDGYEAVITPTIMQGLIEFQKAIHRSYAISRYGTENIQKLTNEEKQALEIRVTVEKGSSLIGFDLQAIAEKFSENLVNKMTGTDALLLVLGVTVLFCGQSAYKYFLDKRLEARKEELKSEEHRASLDAIKFSSEQETQRTKLLVDLALENKQLQLVREQAFIAQTELLKSFKDTQSADISGTKISGELAGDLVKNARRPSHEVRLDGVYRVLIVDSSDLTQFKIRIRNVDTGAEFQAIVEDDSMSLKHRTAIQDAEWARSLIKLQINAREIGGEIKNAIVMSAEEIQKEQE